MNPFQLQADLLRQWLSMTGALATVTMMAWRDLGQQTASAVSKGSAPTYPAIQAWSGLGWPQSAITPMNAFMPWMSALGLHSGVPMWTQLAAHWTALQSSPFTPFALSNPAALSSFMPWAWALQASPSSGPWWSTGRLFAPQPETLLEQMVTNYRTASGYAAATVLGPFGTALEPRIFGQPWWQVSQKRNLH